LDELTLDRQALAVEPQATQEQSVVDIGAELLVWQGRPAPRCFTFRHWGRSLFWLVIFVVAGVWQWVGWEIYADSGQTAWAFVPLPLLVLALCLSIGRVVRARLEWEHVFYVLSAEKLRIQCGMPRHIICFNLAELSYVRLDLYNKNGKNGKNPQGELENTGLGKIYLEFGSRSVVLCCIEHAEGLFELLRRHVAADID